MSWDATWEEVFRNREWGRYPGEELIRFVARNYFRVPDRRTVRILEVGCGAGANLWFIAREGFSAHGIDGSATAIDKSRKRLAEDHLHATLATGDVAELHRHFDAASFDAVIDIACVQHNRTEQREAIVEEMRRLLVTGGRVFAMMVAQGSWGDGRGTMVEEGTYTGITEGPVSGVGLCHFSTEGDVRSLYKDFENLQVDWSARTLGNGQQLYKQWIVEAERL